jgi:hypothetical protein
MRVRRAAALPRFPHGRLRRYIVSDVIHIVIYGFVAALSPTVLLATLVVLGSGRGRLNGIVFLTAFVMGQSLAYVAVFAIGSAFTLGADTSGDVMGVLEVVAGGALVAIAWQRRRAPFEQPAGTSRSEALFARLSRVRPAVSFGVGMPLGVGVKRLLITLFAATSVASADLSRSEEVGVSTLYVVVASAIVWGPVLVYFVLGAHADGMMDEARRWIRQHEQPLLVYSALALGAFLVADGLVALIA